MKDNATLVVIGINILATIVSVFNPILATKISDIYIASIGGLWMKHQVEEARNNDKL